MSSVCGFYCFKTIDLLFIFVEGEGGGVTKLAIFCGRHKCMTPQSKYRQNIGYFASVNYLLIFHGSEFLGPLLFLLYVNDPPQSLSDAGSYFYADDTCIFYQHEDVKKIENVLNKEFLSLCQWFIDNKLSIHFGEDKTKSILFSKVRVRGLKKINISFAGHYIKQCETVEYLGRHLDSKLSGEAMASLKFLYYQGRYLASGYRKLLCNALIQPHFDYGCSS